MLKKLLIGTGIILCAGLFILVGSFLFAIAHLDVDRQIGGPREVTSEWVEFVPDPPLKPSGSEQRVELKVAEPFMPPAKIDFRRMILTNSNTIVRPEVQVVDDRGETHDLESVSYYPLPSNYEGRMSFSSSSDLPPNRVYSRVRIHSDHPFKVTGIYWHCHTGK